MSDNRMIGIFLLLALCNGAISISVTKSRLFRAPRSWIANKSEFWGDFVQCPFCFNHWIAFILVVVFRQKFTNVFWPVDYVVGAFALTALSSIVSGLIYRLFTPPTLRTQDLKDILNQNNQH